VTAALSLQDVSVSYGPVPALSSVDLEVAPGEVLALLGASGSGKTTLLHTVAGFIEPRTGMVAIDGHVVVRPGRWVAPEDRRVGLVFQGAALWPHLDVLDTVAYPIRRGGAPKERARREAYTLLERLGLAALAHRLPSQLSGGEQQRVGLARALARNPGLFLFDEPTAHLDTHLRSVVLEEVARRRQTLGAAALYATHNAAEALAIADRVAVLRAGRLVQLDTPQRVYERPADMETACLTGPASFVDTDWLPKHLYGDGRGQALVRPDWVSLDGDLPGRVESVRYRGPHTDLVVVVGGGRLLVSCPGPPRRQTGDDVGIGLTQAWRMPDDGDGHAVEVLAEVTPEVVLERANRARANTDA
jgi:iron(III) transport system ATP-binding protein